MLFVVIRTDFFLYLLNPLYSHFMTNKQNNQELFQNGRIAILKELLMHAYFRQSGTIKERWVAKGSMKERTDFILISAKKPSFDDMGIIVAES